MEEPIQFNDSRYKSCAYQGFRTFEEGETFLRSYCNRCRIKPECKINYTLRLAMGGNFPFFAMEFIRLNLRQEHRLVNPIPDDSLETRLPETVIACSVFKSKQLSFAFAEN